MKAMMKRVGRYLVQDAPIDGRRIRQWLDERLDAVDPGKCLQLWLKWTGEQRPALDATLAAISEMRTPLTLNPSLIPGSADLGTRWLGDWVAKARSAARDAEASTGEKVDVQGVMQEIENLNTALGIRAPNFDKVADAVRKVKRAADAVTGATRDGRTRDARIIGYSRPHYGTPSRPVSPEQLNAQHSRFWAEQRTTDSRTPGGTDNTSAVRDALAAAGRATDMRTKIDALSAAHRAYWAERAR